MSNRFAIAVSCAAWLAAGAALAQADGGSRTPTALSGVTDTVHKSTQLSGVTVMALPDGTLCRLPSDGPWPGYLFDQASRTKQKRTDPSPGTEQYLRKDMASIEMGTRDYGDMTTEIADNAKWQLPLLEQRFKCLGNLKSIRFLHVSASDFDDYEIDFQNGALEWAIAPLDESKKSHAQYARFYAPQPLTDELYGLIKSIRKDHPDHAVVSAKVAGQLEQRWPLLRQRFKGWDRLQSIYFVRKTNSGAYLYIVTLGHGGFSLSNASLRTTWSVTVDPKGGRVASMTYAVFDGAAAKLTAEAPD